MVKTRVAFLSRPTNRDPVKSHVMGPPLSRDVILDHLGLHVMLPISQGAVKEVSGRFG